MYKLDISILLTASGSGSGLHKSMTRLPSANNSVTTINSQPKGKVSSGGVTVTTNHSPTMLVFPVYPKFFQSRFLFFIDFCIDRYQHTKFFKRTQL